VLVVILVEFGPP